MDDCNGDHFLLVFFFLYCLLSLSLPVSAACFSSSLCPLTDFCCYLSTCLLPAQIHS